jgi:hypothetical protein
LPPPQLLALACKDWRNAGTARLLKPTLRQLLGVIKSGRHGTTVDRFGSLALLKDPAVLHAYQEFLGIDE